LAAINAATITSQTEPVSDTEELIEAAN